MKYNQDYNIRNEQTDMIYGEINTDTIGANSVCMGHLFGQRPTTYGEYIGAPPVTFTTSASKLTDWYIKGAAAGVGDTTNNMVLVSTDNVIHYATYNNFAISNGTITILGAALFGFKVKVEPNTTYTSSVVHVVGHPSMRVREYATEPNNWTDGFINQPVSTNNIIATFTTTAETEWILLGFYGETVGTTVNNLMLNVGSTPLPYEPYGYKIPVVCGGTTTNIYIDTPLTESDTITQTQTGIQIPTTPGTNTLSIDTTVQPSEIYIKYKE